MRILVPREPFERDAWKQNEARELKSDKKKREVSKSDQNERQEAFT